MKMLSINNVAILYRRLYCTANKYTTLILMPLSWSFLFQLNRFSKWLFLKCSSGKGFVEVMVFCGMYFPELMLKLCLATMQLVKI